MRHHSTSIVGPDIDGEVTKEGMIAAMEDASKLVASWPEWKREVLREPDSAQPSMKEAMARVDARAEKIVAGIPLGQRAIVSKDELRPAQPSVGERLGEVARDEWLATGAVTRWDRIALAVRREVLKEVFAEEDVEAAAKAMWNATLPGITWDELREASRKPIWVQAAAALSAAIASRVARARKEKP